GEYFRRVDGGHARVESDAQSGQSRGSVEVDDRLSRRSRVKLLPRDDRVVIERLASHEQVAVRGQHWHRADAMNGADDHAKMMIVCVEALRRNCGESPVRRRIPQQITRLNLAQA